MNIKALKDSATVPRRRDNISIYTFQDIMLDLAWNTIDV